MAKQWEVKWEGELPATPRDTWEGITRHSDGWLWKIEYEPRVGGAERGLTSCGGKVTAWEPERLFRTRSACEPGSFNEIECELEPHPAGTYMRYTHRTVILDDDEFDTQLDACRQHTELYQHSLSEYLRYFAGRTPEYVAAEGPEASADGGAAAVRRALGIAGEVIAGERVRLTPEGLTPVEGVVDYATPAFLGVRTDDALYRFYLRDAWGWPVGVAHHLFGEGDDAEAWQTWLDGVFATTKAVA